MIYILKLLEVVGIRKPTVNSLEFHVSILDDDQMEEVINQILDEREKLILLVRVFTVTTLLLVAGLFIAFKVGHDSNNTVLIPPAEHIGN